MISMKLFFCCKKVFIYVNKWVIHEKSNEKSLPEKYIWSNLNVEDISDADYTHVERVQKNFETENLDN